MSRARQCHLLCLSNRAAIGKPEDVCILKQAPPQEAAKPTKPELARKTAASPKQRRGAGSGSRVKRREAEAEEEQELESLQNGLDVGDLFGDGVEDGVILFDEDDMDDAASRKRSKTEGGGGAPEDEEHGEDKARAEEDEEEAEGDEADSYNRLSDESGSDSVGEGDEW